MQARQQRQFLCVSIIVGVFVAQGCNAGSKHDSPSSSGPVVDADSNADGSEVADAALLAQSPSAVAEPAAKGAENAAAAEATSAEIAHPNDRSAAKTPGKAPAVPFAEWGPAPIKPLGLLVCSDGFGDPAVLDMAIAPDGKQFVLSGAKLTVWNVGDAQPRVEMLAAYKQNEVERPLRAVAVSADGKWLAAGDQKGRVRVWTLSDQSEVVAIPAHNGHVTQLAFSPDSHLLATTSYSGEVNLWQMPDGKKLKSLKMGEQEILRLVFLSDNLLASAGGEAVIWNVETAAKQTALTAKHVYGPALGLSSDGRLLAFNDADSVVRLWDVPSGKLTGRALQGAAAHLIAFSHDGKWVATYSQDSSIRIWDAATGTIAQVIDADGGRTSALSWLPSANAIVVASEVGRVRIWGTPEIANGVGFEPLHLPELKSSPMDTRRPLTSAQLKEVIDIRSFPRLPGAIPQRSEFGICTYTAPAAQKEAELFYRYYLGQAGWQEPAQVGTGQPGLTFRKHGCELNVLFAPAAAPAEGHAKDLQVSLLFAGNYDACWLAKFKPIDSKSSWSSFSSVSYRTKADLTEVEVELLKQFHDAGWTAYTRLAAASNEDTKSRSMSLLQAGSVLTVSIGYPADSAQELFVQTSIGVSNKSVPIPSDAGWIEFDSSTDLRFVINTKMDLQQTAEFFDKQMAAEGWLQREAGRHFKDDKAWLPYIRGQQDIFLRLTALPAGGTRVVAGDAASSSWQLQKPGSDREKTDKPGIEAADFKLPARAAAVKFDVDQKNIEFELTGATPAQLGEQFAAQLEAFDWKRDSAGVASDDYVLVTYTKAKAEIQLRARAIGKKSAAMISGDGLLWAKPTAPVRISYAAWLRRNGREATLDLLDEFAAEMRKIPAAGKGR
jgi:WD40 repeat protein